MDKTPHSMIFHWDWPADDQPIDLHPFHVREWKHDGDSPIGTARPHRQRGEAMPPPTYLLKWGRDAIGERVYSLVAHNLNLPSAVVWWTTSTDLPEAAIRFEPGAWRPEEISIKLGLVRLKMHAEFLLNPLDYYRHLALSAVLGEYDGEEFMVRQQVLFRIDAAYVGSTLADRALDLLYYKTEGKKEKPSHRFQRDYWWHANRIQQNAPYGYQPFVETLEHLAEWAGLPDRVAADIHACPAVDAYALPDEIAQAYKIPAQSMMPLIAEAAASYLCQQQEAIKNALSQL